MTPRTSSRRPKDGNGADLLAARIIDRADLSARYNVGVREFVVLSCIDEQGELDVRGIAKHIGLSISSTEYCLEALMRNGLIRETAVRASRFRSTDDGRALIQESGRPD